MVALVPLLAEATPADAAGVAPLLTLAVGVAIVLVTILWLRLNAFLGLLGAAIVVSLLAPSEPGEQLARVGAAFGATAGSIGIAIALAAVIGSCLIASGAAERVVDAALRLFGERRGASAIAVSGFVLSVPVFFDTVFYLLFPIARSMHRRTGRDYLRYLLAIGAGGAVTHTMVPPTPGPLLMASELGVSIGAMMLVGVLVAGPMTAAGLAYAAWIGRRLVLTNPPETSDADDSPAEPGRRLPTLLESVLPIVTPVVMIASQPCADLLWGDGLSESALVWIGILADKNLALLAAAVIVMIVYTRYARPSAADRSQMVVDALTSAGLIVLITSAGGAFGAMLKAAQIGPAISGLFPTDSQGGGFVMLWMAFGVASLLKSSQGSTTVALITASGMMAAMLEDATLGFHPVYLCAAIGSGAMITSWMNDSGFWIYCKMGGVTEREGLMTWTPIMIVMGAAGMATTLILAWLFPAVG